MAEIVPSLLFQISNLPPPCKSYKGSSRCHETVTPVPVTARHALLNV